jgi:hypothetical protein
MLHISDPALCGVVLESHEELTVGVSDAVGQAQIIGATVARMQQKLPGPRPYNSLDSKWLQDSKCIVLPRSTCRPYALAKYGRLVRTPSVIDVAGGCIGRNPGCTGATFSATSDKRLAVPVPVGALFWRCVIYALLWLLTSGETTGARINFARQRSVGTHFHGFRSHHYYANRERICLPHALVASRVVIFLNPWVAGISIHRTSPHSFLKYLQVPLILSAIIATPSVQSHHSTRFGFLIGLFSFLQEQRQA